MPLNSCQRSPDVLVLGGGIVGLACAREFASRGLRVELLERGDLGGGSTHAAAGMLAPLAEVPEPGPLSEACRLSRDLWGPWAAELEEETGLDLDYDRSGALVLDAEPALRRLESTARKLEEPCERLEAQALRHWLPGLAGESRDGLLLAGEHRIDNRVAARALTLSARQRGAVLSPGHEVLAVRVPADGSMGLRVEGDGWRREAQTLVVAAGAWSGRIEGLPRLPVHPVRGQMLALEGVRWPWLGSIRAAGGYLVRRRGDRLLVGATVEDVGFDDRPTAGGMASLLAFATGLFPQLMDQEISETWSGLRPGTPDHLPILGLLEERIWVATGHFRNGVLLAPQSAVQLADLLTSSEPPAQGAEFSPERFSSQSVT